LGVTLRDGFFVGWPVIGTFLAAGLMTRRWWLLLGMALSFGAIWMVG
jgi:hypothetical protein